MLPHLGRTTQHIFRLSTPSNIWRAVSTQSSSNTPASALGAQRWKEPTRGGQNLTQRYWRLEKTLRGKIVYEQDISLLKEEPTTVVGSNTLPVRPGKRDVNMFMGFVIPAEPKPPAPDECCMSGCAICVQDLYEEALQDYREALQTLRSSLSALEIPQERWPPHVRISLGEDEKKAERKPSMTLSVFEEMEKRLREKQDS